MPTDTDQQPREAQSPAMQVLVVDNDKAHAQAMVESLLRDGYQCELATSGPEGKAKIEQGGFDIVVIAIPLR